MDNWTVFISVLSMLDSMLGPPQGDEQITGTIAKLLGISARLRSAPLPVAVTLNRGVARARTRVCPLQFLLHRLFVASAPPFFTTHSLTGATQLKHPRVCACLHAFTFDQHTSFVETQAATPFRPPPTSPHTNHFLISDSLHSPIGFRILGPA